MTLDLFLPHGQIDSYADQVSLHKGFALAESHHLIIALAQIQSRAPLRHMKTPGGHTMSVATTNCGQLGWVSDQQGYRYVTLDPLSKKPWPRMPSFFIELAHNAAEQAGFKNFIPDSCLINVYQHGAKMGLHQDRDEADFSFPIVSVSLGIDAQFQLGGFKRQDKTQRITLQHGDILVWGGVDRLRYHGILTIKNSNHTLTNNKRINLTFRKAGPL